MELLEFGGFPAAKPCSAAPLLRYAYQSGVAEFDGLKAAEAALCECAAMGRVVAGPRQKRADDAGSEGLSTDRVFHSLLVGGGLALPHARQNFPQIDCSNDALRRVSSPVGSRR